ncbi:hypothetical protein [Pseudomonas sp. dw_358]|uniref:hypothetical protein n=1 Tax=Pseudomonas sp. dw_358 TaxID=2720083 RepID=UPI001BD26517|nr:hypothetical protein [Pseudomonas sp. dw_358]
MRRSQEDSAVSRQKNVTLYEILLIFALIGEILSDFDTFSPPEGAINGSGAGN